MEDELRSDDIDEDFNGSSEINDGYEIGIAWRPKRDIPITVLILRINRVKVAGSNTDDNSPFVVTTIPSPDAEHKFEVAWAISPEVPIDRILIAIRNRATNAFKIVATTRGLARGKLWQNAGTKVDAP